MHLSASTAQLVALLLNLLHGILRSANSDASKPSVELIFGFRVIQGESEHLANALGQREPPQGLEEELRKISNAAGTAADALGNATKEDSPRQYEQLARLLEAPYALWQRTSERKAVHHLVWSERSIFSSNLTDEMSNRCISELFTTSSGGDCRPSRDCLDVMLHTKHLTNYALSRQLIYFTVASRQKLCRKALLSYWSMNQTALTVHLNELCSNVIHEMELFLSRVPKDLDALTPLQKDLLMQHVFVCGQHGFVDVVQPRILWMLLGQQNEDGCYPLPAKDAAPQIGRRLLASFSRSGCSGHSTAVAAGASMVYLDFLLASSGWADFHVADAAFTVPHRVIQHNRFAQLNWQLWTKDRHAAVDADALPDGEPPHLHNIKSDVISFIVIFVGIFVFITATQHYCGASPKQLYAYSYKKL